MMQSRVDEDYGTGVNESAGQSMMVHDMTMSRMFCLVAPLVIVFASGCATDSRGIALLPSPSQEKMQFSKYEPANAYTRLEGGSLTRSSFATVEAGYAIEVRDFLFGPALKVVQVDIDGAAILEVRDGAGVARIGDKVQVVEMGATFAVSEGEKLWVEARDGPLLLRAHVFRVAQ